MQEQGSTVPAARIATFLLATVLAAAQTKSRNLTYEENAPPNASVAVPRGYVLIVDIADYKNLPAKSHLQFSERDADAMYSILINPEAGNFHAENVHRLSGAKATLANLKQELEVWLPSVAKEDDRVLIYFSGHGFMAGGRAYLAPYDLDPANIPATGYPLDQLASIAASKISAKNKVLITDSCRNSGIAADADAREYNRRLLDLSSSMFSLTATRDRERSLESADWGGGHGVFTYYVAKGLQGDADENADGIVTAGELADYTSRNVREATKEQQNPASARGNVDPDALAAYIPAGLRAAKPLRENSATPGSGPRPGLDCGAPEVTSLCTLLRNGAPEEVIHQLDPRVQHKKPASAALPLLAQAYRMKEQYPQAIESARAAIKLAPQAAEPHLWLADSLRLSMQYRESMPEYIEFLRLNSFDHEPGSGTIDHLHAYLAKTGRKKIDASTEEWRSLRSVAYSSMCEAERNLMLYEPAIGYCQKSLAYDPTDPYTHYTLALCYMHEAQANGSIEMLAAAQAHFQTMIELGPDLEEAKSAKANLRNIDSALQPRP